MLDCGPVVLDGDLYCVSCDYIVLGGDVCCV